MRDISMDSVFDAALLVEVGSLPSMTRFRLFFCFLTSEDRKESSASLVKCKEYCRNWRKIDLQNVHFSKCRVHYTSSALVKPHRKYFHKHNFRWNCFLLGSFSSNDGLTPVHWYKRYQNQIICLNTFHI